nr:MAG TPA: hypothetical protein [Caudoviricetes sp.]
MTAPGHFLLSSQRPPTGGFFIAVTTGKYNSKTGLGGHRNGVPRRGVVSPRNCISTRH